MREAIAHIRGRECSISTGGRITVAAGPDPVREPPFIASVSELETLSLIAQGLTFDQASLKRELATVYIRQQMERLRKLNAGKRTSALAAIGTDLDLLNPLAIEGINVLSGYLRKRCRNRYIRY